MPSIQRLGDACRPHRLVWLTRYGSSADVIRGVFGETVILCLENSYAPRHDNDLRIHSYESLTGCRENWSDDPQSWYALWSMVQRTLRGRQWRVLGFRPRNVDRRWARARASRFVGGSPALRSQLASKTALFHLLDSLGLPRLAGEWAVPKGSSFKHYRQRLGLPFVMQLDRSASGFGTAIIRTDDDFRHAVDRFGDTEMWVSRYGGHRSLNVNGLALETGSVVGYPSVQLTGPEFLGRAEGSYCGNDYSATAAMPGALLRDLRRQTERIGDALAMVGFRGIFGLDFVISDRDSRLRAVDLNPRWQGSSALLGHGQSMADRANLPATAIAIAAGLVSPARASRERDAYFEPIEGAHYRVPWTGETKAVPLTQLRPGIYSRARTLSWKRPARGPGELDRKEFLITERPAPKIRLAPHSRLCSIVTRDSVLDTKTWRPLEWVARVNTYLSRLTGNTAPQL